MKKLPKSKILILLAICLCVAIFNGMIFNVSVIKRDIVVGVGLDFDGMDYTLYTQVVLPKNGGVASGSGNNYVTFKAQADSIDLAIDAIEKQQGSVLSFAQAAILVMGKNMVENGDLGMVETFFMDDRVHDNFLLAMAEEKAEDVLGANVAAGEISTLQLVKQLRPTKEPIGISAISLQEYMRNAATKYKINYLPVVSVQQSEPSTDQSKENLDKADIFVPTRTAIIDDNKLQCILDEQQTQSFNLVKKKMQDGVLKVTGSNPFSVHIISAKASTSYDLAQGECSIKIKLETIRTEAKELPNGKITFRLTEDEVTLLQRSISDRLQALFEYGLSQNLDIYNVRDGFAKKYPCKTSQILSENFLQGVKINVKTDISQVN